MYSRLNTARSWILFATVYSREFAELTGRHQLASPPEMEDCKSLIRAEPLNWGTTLITPSRRTDHVELSSIFEITNLLALELVFGVEPQFYPQVTLTDRNVRGWSEMARDGKAFQHLRLLSLFNQNQLTENIFHFLDDFPSLVVISLVGCSPLTDRKGRLTAAKFGWKTKSVSGTAERMPDTLCRLGLDRKNPWDEDSPDNHIIPVMQVSGSPWRDFPTGLNLAQIWFTRERPKAKDCEPAKRKSEATVTAARDRPRRSKRPALRSSSTTHMQKNAAAAQELLGFVFPPPCFLACFRGNG